METRKIPASSAAVTGVTTTSRLPFGDGNAAGQWHPAMAQVNKWAATQGLDRVESRGSGVSARGINPPVKAIELQTITVVKKDGSRHDVGTVIPEGAHMRELKSTSELVAEIKQLITAKLQAAVP